MSTAWQNSKALPAARQSESAGLNRSDDFSPGTVLFRSDQTFQVLSPVVSHSRLLQSAGPSAADEGCETTVQVPVKAAPGATANAIVTAAFLGAAAVTATTAVAKVSRVRRAGRAPSCHTR